MYIVVRRRQRKAQQHLILDQRLNIKRGIRHQIVDVLTLILGQRQTAFVRNQQKYRTGIEFEYQRPETALANQMKLSADMQCKSRLAFCITASRQPVAHLAPGRKQLIF